MKIYRFTCPKCGGTDVTCDAIARWDEAQQQFVVVEALDCAECEDCGEIEWLERTEIDDA